MSTQELERRALSMTPRARAKLARKLLKSLETLSEEENDKLWIEEAQRRDDEWSGGRAKRKAGEKVLKEIRSRLR
jgi:hypothetical protein